MGLGSGMFKISRLAGRDLDRRRRTCINNIMRAKHRTKAKGVADPEVRSPVERPES